MPRKAARRPSTHARWSRPGEEQQDIDDSDSYFAEGLRKWRNEIGVTTTQRDADYATGYAAEKVRENRLRRMAERQGHQLVKSRRRDPRAYDYGRYWITDPATKVIVAAMTGSA